MTRRAGGGKPGDDGELFRRTMAGVAPLAGKAARVPLGGRGASAGGVRPFRPAPRGAGVEAPPEFVIEDDGMILAGSRAGVAPSLLARLRRGEMVVQAELDLHGLRIAEAEKAVVAFLERSHASGLRGVLIIHGKGTHSASGQPVLRGEIARWLTTGHAARRVLCFATPPHKDGGGGALYVRIQRAPPKAVP